MSTICFEDEDFDVPASMLELGSEVEVALALVSNGYIYEVNSNNTN